ncbi:MAG TPA: hypothetical protein VGF76_24350, partial [Polyangiaceae bacterium]
MSAILRSRTLLWWCLFALADGMACTSASQNNPSSASGASGVSGSTAAAGTAGTAASTTGLAGTATSDAGTSGSATSAAGMGGLGQAGFGGVATGGAGGQGGNPTSAVVPYTGLRQSNVIIGNVFLFNLDAVAFVSNDEAAVLLQVSADDKPGTAAPDGSINKLRFSQDGANVSFDWTRTGNAIAARLSVDKPITFAVKLIPSWPSFNTSYSGSPDGAVATAAVAQGK